MNLLFLIGDDNVLIDTNTSHADNNYSIPHISSPADETVSVEKIFGQLNCGENHTNADTLYDSNVTGTNVYRFLLKWAYTEVKL